MLLVFFAIISISPAKAIEKIAKIDEVAPDFQLTTQDGKKIVLSEKKGKVVILVFWAFWCDTWKSVAEGYLELQNDMKGIPFEYLVVAIDETMPEVVKLEIKEGKLPFPVLVDRSGNVSKIYRIKAVPTFIVLNKENKIVYRREGYPGNVILKKLIWELNKDEEKK